MTTLTDRLATIQERIARAVASSGREPGCVTLVAVSKRQPDALVDEAIAAGQHAFGENLVQPWAARGAAYPDSAWHLIGPVQSKKANLVWRHRPALLHTVDRVKLIDALERRQELAPGTALPALIQVNVDAEPQKSGVLPEQLDAMVDRVTASGALQLRGLMCIPRPPDGGGPPVDAFARLRSLAEGVSDRLGDGYELSMGMSGDFETAIAEGATIVRVGTAIFGTRS